MSRSIAFFVCLPCSCLAVQATAEKVLIVADEWPQMAVLADYLQAQGGYDVEKAKPDELPGDLTGYDGVFQFVHGALPDACAQQLIAYAQEGGRLVVLHHGISSKKKETQGWFAFLGIELDRTDGAEHYYRWVHGVTFTLVNVNPGHYITSHNVTYPRKVEYQSSDQPSPTVELPAIALANTEVYFNHQFTDARAKTVLFGVRYEDAKTGEVLMQDRAGWYKQTGRGYLFYFQPGHAVSDFEQADYCQILLNCLTWKPGS